MPSVQRHRGGSCFQLISLINCSNARDMSYPTMCYTNRQTNVPTPPTTLKTQSQAPPVLLLRNTPAPSLAISGLGASTDASFSFEDHHPFFCAAASIRARNCTASRATNLLIIQAGMFPPGSTVPMQMNIIRIHHKVRMCMNVQVSPARTLSLSASDQGRG